MASREQMDILLSESLSTATAFLKKRREFYPFAVAVSSDGTIVHVSKHTEEEYPDAKALLETLWESLVGAAGNGDYLALAVVSNVQLTDTKTGKKGDAVSVELQHSGGDPTTCYLPYEFKGGELCTGTLVAQRSERRVFW